MKYKCKSTQQQQGERNRSSARDQQKTACYRLLTETITRLINNELFSDNSQLSEHIPIMNELRASIKLAIHKLFKDTASQPSKLDIKIFHLSIDNALDKAQQQYKLEFNLFDSIIRPAIMGLVGIILGIITSPVLPFSSTVRNYVGSFFRSPIENLLKQEVEGVRTFAINSVTIF